MTSVTSSLMTSIAGSHLSRVHTQSAGAVLLGLVFWSSIFPMAAQCRPQNQEASTSNSGWGRIYGYEDDSGTIHLTNVVSSASGIKHYSVIIDQASNAVTAGNPGSAHLPLSADLRIWTEEAGRENHLEAALLYAIMLVESGYDPLAISPKGARGVMQLMPETGQLYGVTNPFDSRESVFAGARHLRNLLDEFGENLTLAVAAYNAGAAAVSHYRNSVPPFPETQAYVPKVLSLYEKFRSTPASR